MLKKIRWHVSSILAIITRIIMFRDRGKDWKHNIPLELSNFSTNNFFFLTKIFYTVQSVSKKKKRRRKHQNSQTIKCKDFKWITFDTSNFTYDWLDDTRTRTTKKMFDNRHSQLNSFTVAMFSLKTMRCLVVSPFVRERNNARKCFSFLDRELNFDFCIIIPIRQ